MECPYCGWELRKIDYKGREIYACENEKCIAFQEYFYIDKEGDLEVGYPC